MDLICPDSKPETLPSSGTTVRSQVKTGVPHMLQISKAVNPRVNPPIRKFSKNKANPAQPLSVYRYNWGCRPPRHQPKCQVAMLSLSLVTPTASFAPSKCEGWGTVCFSENYSDSYKGCRG